MEYDNDFPPGVAAEKVREYRRMVAQCWIVVGLLTELPLEAMDHQSARAETLGPMLYPEIWRANAKAIMEDREMIRALVSAQRNVLTTSPSLRALAPTITAQVNASSATLDAAFTEIFSRRPVSAVPPVVVLSALVRFIAHRVPSIEGNNAI